MPLSHLVVLRLAASAFATACRTRCQCYPTSRPCSQLS
ncbi:hypothetical protein PITC_076740 [Penicillium italicum]|uniref:Uncharacterized protein n=1 Tax=Penicillium italicum TaxID=40296 RepID=A0A0A2KLU1_PENIT|nr:hypothetical protein PITC_076740 [Penicillium italicum]